MRTFIRLLALLAFAGSVHAGLPASVTAATTCIQGAQGVAPTITLTFTAPTTNTNGTAITLPLTYTVFQGATSGSEVQVASGLTGSPIVVNTGLTAGSTAYVYLVVVDANGDSVPSTEACKTFPAAAPAIPNPVTNFAIS